MPLDKNGHEIPDESQVAIPVRFKKSVMEYEIIKRMVRAELSEAAANSGFETFEEANDFDVGDDFEPDSPYEFDVSDEEYLQQLRAANPDEPLPAPSAPPPLQNPPEKPGDSTPP